MFWADDARAEGVCSATCKAIPGVDVVVEGAETSSRIAEIAEEWARTGEYNAGKLAHLFAGWLLDTAIPPSLHEADLDPDKVLDCTQAFYDIVQARVYVKLSTMDPNNIDWTFLQQGHPWREHYLQPEIDTFYDCLDNADREAPDCSAYGENTGADPEKENCCCQDCVEVCEKISCEPQQISRLADDVQKAILTQFNEDHDTNVTQENINSDAFLFYACPCFGEVCYESNDSTCSSTIVFTKGSEKTSVEACVIGAPLTGEDDGYYSGGDDGYGDDGYGYP